MSQIKSLIKVFLATLLFSALAMAISIQTQLFLYPSILNEKHSHQLPWQYIWKLWLAMLIGGAIYYFARIKIAQLKNHENNSHSTNPLLAIPIILIAALLAGFGTLRCYSEYNNRFAHMMKMELKQRLDKNLAMEDTIICLIVREHDLTDLLADLNCKYCTENLVLALYLRNIDKDRLLLSAAATGNIESIRLLLANGANINIQGYRYFIRIDAEEETMLDKAPTTTALMNAAQNGQDDALRYLLANGANIFITDDAGRTALHYAKTMKCAKLLIDAGINVNAQDRYGATPLHNIKECSSEYYSFHFFYFPKGPSYPERVCVTTENLTQYFISAGAEINAKDNEGRTPLYYAVLKENAHIIKILIETGADVNLSDKQGVTPLQLAYDTKLNEQMIKLLIAHGAK